MKYSGSMIMAVLLLYPSAAAAHPGDHSPLAGMLAALWHLVTEPDHALILLAASLRAVVLSVSAVRAAKAAREEMWFIIYPLSLINKRHRPNC